MFCAECGNRIKELSNGSYEKCCRGIGYWYNIPPHPSNMWMITKTYKEYYLYSHPFRIFDIKVVYPNERS
jgi:hypothetical protein